MRIYSKSNRILLAIFTFSLLSTLSASVYADDPKWKTIPNVAQYKKADWSGKIGPTMSFATVEQAKKHAEATPEIDFFFYCRSGMYLETLGESGQFKAKDAVFFKGEPWYGSAPQCDAYERVKVTLKPCQAAIQVQQEKVTDLHQRYASGNFGGNSNPASWRALIASEQAKLDEMKKNCQ